MFAANTVIFRRTVAAPPRAVAGPRPPAVEKVLRTFFHFPRMPIFPRLTSAAVHGSRAPAIASLRWVGRFVQSLLRLPRRRAIPVATARAA